MRGRAVGSCLSDETQWVGILCVSSESQQPSASLPLSPLSTFSPPLSEPLATTTLPYNIQGLSEPMQKLLPSINIRTRFHLNCTLRQILVKPKDPSQLHPSTILYTRSLAVIACLKTYLGQSNRPLNCRLKEHKLAVWISYVGTSAVACMQNTTVRWDIMHIATGQ